LIQPVARNQKNMTSTATKICNTDWKRMSRTVEQQITDEQMAMLPSDELSFVG